MTLRLWPRSLVGQLVFAVAVMLFIAQAVNFVLLSRGQRQQSFAHGGGMAVARIIDAIERDRRGDTRRLPDARARDSREERERNQRLVISDLPPPVPPGAAHLPDLAAYVAGLLDEAEIPARNVDAWILPQRQRTPHADMPRPVFVSARIGDRYFAVRTRIGPENGRLQGFLIWQTLSLYLLLLIPIMVIAWRAAAPLRGLTRAARANPALRDTIPLAEEGPSDVRDLIAAFNAYRARIATMLSDKDRMLGAVGHDLRTPLASLRVRVEAVEDEALRDKMIATIEEMTAMLADILAFARSGAGKEAAQDYDAATLLSQMGEEYRMMGKAVVGPDALPPLPALSGRPLLVRRALRNLIDNALAYAGSATLMAEVRNGELRLIVCDDGPGIDPALIADLVEPFARGEASRSRTTGGAGLGLAIANALAEGEGGRLEIANRADRTGIEAAIVLPV